MMKKKISLILACCVVVLSFSYFYSHSDFNRYKSSGIQEAKDEYIKKKSFK